VAHFGYDALQIVAAADSDRREAIDLMIPLRRY
jgi:hypothetical protein